MGKPYSKEVRCTNPSPKIATQLLAADCEGRVEVAADLLRSGKLVAIPTETVYGLAANALNADAVRRIFRAKKRPFWDPLIVHVADENMLPGVVREISPAARKLIAAFWPGPLTLLLPRRGRLPKIVTAARDLVGVRMPNSPITIAVIRAARVPLAAPSANLFGHVSPTTASHVLADLNGRINAVLDAGPCSIGVESTVLDPREMVIYRQGGVSAAEIERVTGTAPTVYHSAAVTAPENLPSPGVAARHYAPAAHLRLVRSEGDLQQALAAADPEGTGAMIPADWSVPGWTGRVFPWGRWSDAAALAQSLYSGLRALEAEGVNEIICPLPPEGGKPVAEAVRDRLIRAAHST